MGIDRKLSLFLCCLIPIYGLSTGRNETKIDKPPLHEEYDDPLYSLNILRPLVKEIPQNHHRDYLMKYKSLHKHHRSMNKNLKGDRKDHLSEEPETFEYLKNGDGSYKHWIVGQNAVKYLRNSEITHLKERHSHQHKSKKNTHSRGIYNSRMVKHQGGKSKSDVHHPPPQEQYLISKGKKYRRHNAHHGLYSHHQHLPEKEVQNLPYFGSNTPSVVISQVDSHAAFLPCVVHDLDDQTVSWIRNRDAHILTVNRYTFISGNRFLSWFEAESNTWTLKIKFISEEDAGSYECQLSTEPKMSHFVNLTVIVPEVTIPEGRELYVRRGSDISLKCVISNTILPPPFVLWYYGSDELNRGAVNQATVTSLPNNKSIATLVLKNAAKRHAGNYTCAPSGISRSTSVMLHVLNGEHPAAMHHSANIVCKLERTLLVVGAIAIFLVYYHNNNISS